MPTRHHSGPRMSQIVVHDNTIYVAEAGCNDHQPAGGIPDAGDAEQDRDAAGRGRRQPVGPHFDGGHISHSGDFAAMNEVYDSWVDKNNLPARTCVGRVSRIRTCGWR